MSWKTAEKMERAKMSSGYLALREGAAWIDLSARGRIRVLGQDRARLLHAMCTNHVQQLRPGDGVYAFFLNAQGRILTDAMIFCLRQEFLLDVPESRREFTLQHLEQYIIADDVTLRDLTGDTCEIAVEGPRAEAILSAMGAPLPEAAYSFQPWGEGILARASYTGAPGLRILTTAAEKFDVVRRLRTSGIPQATEGDAEIVRLENGRPLYGTDITDRYIPHETGVLEALHFNKGCYLGQEVVERVRSRGLVHRKLTSLRIDAPEAPPPGAKIMTGEKEAGLITSAAYSPAEERVAALGYVRLDVVAEGRPLSCAGYPVQLPDQPGR